MAKKTNPLTVEALRRVTFQFVGRDAELVDYEDYH